MKTELNIKKWLVNSNQLRKVIICAMIILYCNIMNSFAQEPEFVFSSVKGTKGSYKTCYEKREKKRIIYEKITNDHLRLLKDYPACSDGEFVGYKIKIHENFVRALYSAFKEDRIKELSEKNEILEVHFDIDQDGAILEIWFVLSYGTLVNPDELFSLEERLKEIIKFYPIRKSKFIFSSTIGVETNFKEIQNKEIPFIRRMEEISLGDEKLYNP